MTDDELNEMRQRWRTMRGPAAHDVNRLLDEVERLRHYAAELALDLDALSASGEESDDARDAFARCAKWVRTDLSSGERQ